mmetsp:Transcript_6536/g.11866  ORF Transcript_6536/g.11866 Transcript_6536/m.11866 type:complete len:246 (+) Transcript_6536:93-830(+)
MTNEPIKITTPLHKIKVIDNCDASVGRRLRQFRSSNAAQCEICFDTQDEMTPSNELIFVHCFDQETDVHWFCRLCTRMYLFQCENDRKEGPLVCPHDGCSTTLSEILVKEVLQRPYRPKVWYGGPQQEQPPNNNNVSDDENDLAFHQWIAEQDYMQCQNCQAYIMRDEGCGAMQCLCGWRFCFECKTPIHDDSVCDCFYEAHDFYDNILKSEGMDQAPTVATQDELQDMAGFYSRRQKLDGYERV